MKGESHEKLTKKIRMATGKTRKAQQKGSSGNWSQEKGAVHMKLISRRHHIEKKLESQAIQAKRIEIKSLKSKRLRIERKMDKLNTRFERRGPADSALNRYWMEFLCPELKITEAMIAAAEIELRFLIEKEESK